MATAGGLKFALAITCIDGRVQRPVVDYLRKTYGFDYVDLITIPGPEHSLTHPVSLGGAEYVKLNGMFSIENHKASLVALAAHDDCAGNSAPREVRDRELEAAVKSVSAWTNGVPVVGVWVDKSGNVREVVNPRS